MHNQRRQRNVGAEECGSGGGDQILNPAQGRLVEAVIDGAADGVLVKAQLLGDVGLGQALLREGGFDAACGWGLSFGAWHGKGCYCDTLL